MKIKCPACAALLQVPDSAAGKVIKCKCGKQLRAPAPKSAGGGAATAQATRSPAAASPVAGGGVGSARRTAAQSATVTGAAAPVPSGIFDELTESDLSGVRSVQVPGQSVPKASPSANTSKLLSEAMNAEDKPSGKRVAKPKKKSKKKWVVLSGLTVVVVVGAGGVAALLLR